VFPFRLTSVVVVVAVVLAVALGGARPSSGAAPEERYVVRSGDTLWDVAASRYGGDPRKGVWLIRERNGLDEAAALRPGLVLMLP
jgi:nucleoid-associated protein YgaU